jgi:acyl-CoA oxidase
VQGLETTITYDAAAGEFVVHSPTETAQKFWIGGAVSASQAVVFGQLWVGGENRGVHAVVVGLRDAEGGRVPGVTVADCGHKEGAASAGAAYACVSVCAERGAGLNGVDNGRIWFDHVRCVVPACPTQQEAGLMCGGAGSRATTCWTASARCWRTAPLCRSCARQPSASRATSARHGWCLRVRVVGLTVRAGELVGGRVFLAAGANNIAKVAVATAVRYGLSRRQFSEGKGAETLIMARAPAACVGGAAV